MRLINSKPTFLTLYILLFLDKSSAQQGRGRRKKTASLEAADQTDGSKGYKSDGGVGEKQDFKVNEEGRVVCPICDKTFKTVSRTLHMCLSQRNVR